MHGEEGEREDFEVREQSENMLNVIWDNKLKRKHHMHRLMKEASLNQIFGCKHPTDPGLVQKYDIKSNQRYIKKGPCQPDIKVPKNEREHSFQKHIVVV